MASVWCTYLNPSALRYCKVAKDELMKSDGELSGAYEHNFEWLRQLLHMRTTLPVCQTLW